MKWTVKVRSLFINLVTGAKTMNNIYACIYVYKKCLVDFIREINGLYTLDEVKMNKDVSIYVCLKSILKIMNQSGMRTFARFNLGFFVTEGNRIRSQYKLTID